MIQVKEVICRSVLSPSKLPGCDFVINPYIGCAHGCVWCYARFMKGYTGHDIDRWGDFVDVKINAPAVLLKDIRKLKLKNGYPEIFLSSVCDPYQPTEAKYKITRKCLEILSPFSFPVSILTQSGLVTRDIDLFKKFKDIRVGMSFITMNKKATRIFQPRTASPKERVEALRKLHEAGIKTYIHLGPILPYFTDFEEIFKQVGPYVDEVMGETLNTKGENWISFIEVLERYYPQWRGKFEKRKFRDRNYFEKIEIEFEKAAKKYKIATGGIYHHA